MNSGWADGGEVPAKHAGGAAGQSISPALSWTNVPAGTVEFALIMNDPEPVRPANSFRGDILHWMILKIPASTTSLAEGAGNAYATTLPAGARLIRPYQGPGAPAAGPVHHYTITVYALNAPLDLPATLTQNDRAAVEAAIEGKVLGRAIWVGRFKQPAP
jgi:Raf kinase inhibitor-like YbhB/YbcL family protein